MAEDCDVLDSWEELEDKEVLDKKLQEINDNVKNQHTESRNRLVGSGVSLLHEDTSRTTYQPQVKILKRQPGSTVNPVDSVGNAVSVQVSRPMKTLEQREAEYAQARLRIMGCATGYDGETNSDNRPVRLLQQLDAGNVSDNVVSRQPKGPDGTRGFNGQRKKSHDN